MAGWTDGIAASEILRRDLNQYMYRLFTEDLSLQSSGSFQAQTRPSISIQKSPKQITLKLRKQSWKSFRRHSAKAVFVLNNRPRLASIPKPQPWILGAKAGMECMKLLFALRISCHEAHKQQWTSEARYAEADK
jgi:hypothetical protein